MDALILRRASLVATIGGLLMSAGAPMKSASATDLTGLAESSICDDSSVCAPPRTGSSGPPFAPNCFTSTPALTPVSLLVPGACGSSFLDGTNTVTLTDYFRQRPDIAGKPIDLVSPVNNTPNGQADFVGQFTVVVTAGDTAQGSITGVPEPASVGILGAGLLALWHRKRGRRD